MSLLPCFGCDILAFTCLGWGDAIPIETYSICVRSSKALKVFPFLKAKNILAGFSDSQAMPCYANLNLSIRSCIEFVILFNS
jgi:hypothetical protein